MSTEPLIDELAIEALKSINPDDGGEFVREIIEIFLEDTPARLAELDEALAHHETPKFVRAAHSIKGSASNVGAARLRETAERLEHGARDQGFEGLDKVIEQLKTDFTDTETELRDYMSRL